MPVLVSLSGLREGEVELRGVLPAEELDLQLGDPCLQVRQPVAYDLVAELMGDEVFVRGAVRLTLDCVCVRCLEPFQAPLDLDPWTALVAISGPDAAALVDEAVDLTPHIREDSLLALPQHPACRVECRGLPSQSPQPTLPEGPSNEVRRGSPAWSALDGLNLE